MCSATLVYNSTTSSMRYHLAHKHKKADDADATTSSQTSIRDFTIRQKCDTGRAEKMTQLIAEMTAEDLLPISFVEGEGFKTFNELRWTPLYCPIAQNGHCKDWCSIRKNALCSLKDSLSKPARVAITTDLVDLANRWIVYDANLSLHKWMENSQRSIRDARFRGKTHSCEHCNYLKDATEKWLLSSEKVMACVHDNAANMVLANRSLWESVPCFAHTLQLAINEGFNVATVKM